MEFQKALYPRKKQDFEELDTTRKVVTRGYRDIETQVKQFLEAGIALDESRMQYEFNGVEEENFDIDSKTSYYEEIRPTVDNLNSTKERVEALVKGRAAEELSIESTGEEPSDSEGKEQGESTVDSVGKSDKAPDKDSGSTAEKKN